MSLRVVREETIRVTSKEEVMVIEAKVHVWVKRHRQGGILDLWKDLPGVSVEETDFNILARFYTQLNLASNWQLNSESIGNFEWERKPKLGLGLLNINISSLIAPILQDQINRIADQIDDFIQKEINFPKRIHEIWDAISTPYQLHDYWLSYLLFINGSPKIYSNSLQWNPLKLSMNFRTQHTPAVFVQNTFPSFEISNVPDFHISESLDSPPSRINVFIKPEDISQYLLEKSFQLNTYSSLFIKEIKVETIDGKWNIQLDLSLTLKWWRLNKTFDFHSRLQFQPILGDTHQWVALGELAYDLETSPLLLEWWNKYSEESLKDQILSELNKWIQDIQTIVITIGKEVLSGTDLHPNALLKGELLQVEAEQVIQTDNYLMLTLVLHLNTEIELHDF